MNYFTKLHFKLMWPIYAVGIVFGVAISNLLVTIAIKPSKIETLSVFIGAKNSSKSSLDSYLEANKPDSLSEVNLAVYATSGSYYSTYYSLNGLSVSDFMIIPYSTFGTSDGMKDINDYYCSIDETYMSTLFESNDLEFMYIQVDENTTYTCGLKVYDGTTRIGILNEFLSTLIDEEETYYLFFNQYSVHILDMNSDSYDNAAFEILRTMKNYAI